MGGSAREIVLDIVSDLGAEMTVEESINLSEFGCRNDSGGSQRDQCIILRYSRVSQW